MRTSTNYIPIVGMRVRRLLGFDRAGDILTIEEVIAGPDDFATIRGVWESDGYRGRYDAERFESLEPLGPPEAIDSAVSNFVIGQEVVISERIRTPENGQRHKNACAIANSYIGQECIVAEIRASDGWIHISWNNGNNSWWLPSQYLDAVKLPSLDFTTSWRLAVRGTPSPVLMDALWPKMAANIQNLSREKGDWNSLIVSRAVLRLRRQMPNSHEEAIAKNRDWTSTWTTAWTAIIQ